MTSWKQLYLLSAVIVLTACSTVVQQTAQTAQTEPPVQRGDDGVACVGVVPTAVNGLMSSQDTSLQAQAKNVTDKGGVCAAQSFVATTPVTVYRVYDSSRAWTAYGSWWSLTRPVGPRDEYRAKNAICKEWSSLDRLIACQVKPQSELVLGTTQSATCADGSTYPKTADIQVYLPNDSRQNKLFVENCKEEGIWPTPP